MEDLSVTKSPVNIDDDLIAVDAVMKALAETCKAEDGSIDVRDALMALNGAAFALFRCIPPDVRAAEFADWSGALSKSMESGHLAGVTVTPPGGRA